MPESPILTRPQAPQVMLANEIQVSGPIAFQPGLPVPKPPPYPKEEVKQKRTYHRRTPEEKARDEAEKAAKKRERQLEKERKKAEKAKKEAEKASQKDQKSSLSKEERAFNKLRKLREKQIHQEEQSAVLRKKMTLLEAQMTDLEDKLNASENKEDELHDEYVEMADDFEEDFERDPDEELPSIPKIPKKSLVGFKKDEQPMSGEVIEIEDGKYKVQILELEHGHATKRDIIEMDESDLEVVG